MKNMNKIDPTFHYIYTIQCWRPGTHKCIYIHHSKSDPGCTSLPCTNNPL